ncbi:hypothetical protein MMC07_008390 [Pseudocyphellaria aurata]|nr:hypothetical protein [Pseudocyphellaria aurata]
MVILRPEHQWLAEGDAFRFCESPNGNARALSPVRYLEEVLEEMEAERRYSEDYWAEVDPTNERGRLVDALLFPIVPLGLGPEAPEAPEDAPVVVPVVAPAVAPVDAPVVAPVVAPRPRRRNPRGRVGPRQQPHRPASGQGTTGSEGERDPFFFRLQLLDSPTQPDLFGDYFFRRSSDLIGLKTAGFADSVERYRLHPPSGFRRHSQIYYLETIFFRSSSHLQSWIRRHLLEIPVFNPLIISHHVRTMWI